MTIESSIEKMAISIERLALAMESMLSSTQNIHIPVKAVEAKTENKVEKTNKSQKKKESGTPPNVIHADENTGRETIVKMMRAELRRVVQAKGEKTAVELLKKYGAEMITDIKEVDAPSFLTDAAELISDGGGVTLSEVGLPKIKAELKAFAKVNGEKEAIKILDEFGIKKLSDLNPESYEEFYQRIQEVA